ncbi:HD domain-containing protein [Eubacterium sp. AF15-50]|uniref:deoxyguanosinetriphosphate triphosphohydrolase family protein n=1 Tax=unclassified Eubacterium (in: firmicutes) TaxID=2624479 RepID=UPI000E49102D|nr:MULTISPECIES: HD domain-containing protein [unclassified Eubacterium (in: firmicutes)]RHR70798.1 HD domain-containing protein [Eubacterium sp. AF16-48]RHR78249.1 HD domain-containing protein [Eubacterium sp. AF15-50]
MLHYNDLSKELQERILDDRKNHRDNPYAFLNEDVLRRNMSHDKNKLLRPAFVRDCEKIMHLPMYNRYADKTQVFSLYKNDDISRRSSHVQLVSRIARNIGGLLGLNTDLIEAISLGHDIGHTPFGHAGERKLNELYFGSTGRYFNHNVHSVRVLDKIFPQNLSMQTLDGILCHNGEMELEKYMPREYADFKIFDEKVEECYKDKDANRRLVPATLEACVMRISDIIAYLGKDRQDAQKLGLFEKEPDFFGGKIGNTNAEIINNMIVNIVENSYGKNYLKMDKDYFEAFSQGKKENYEMIYGNVKVGKVYEEEINPMMEEIYLRLLKDAKSHNKESVLYKHHIAYVKKMTGYYSDVDYEENTPDDIVVDYIASMTDDYFVDLYKYLFPKGKHEVKYIGYFNE